MGKHVKCERRFAGLRRLVMLLRGRGWLEGEISTATPGPLLSRGFFGGLGGCVSRYESQRLERLCGNRLDELLGSDAAVP